MLSTDSHQHVHTDHRVETRVLHSVELHKDKPVVEVAAESLAHGNHGDHEIEHHHDMSEEHSRIGISLVAGFIFMLLVDQIGGGHAHSSDDTGQYVS